MPPIPPSRLIVVPTERERRVISAGLAAIARHGDRVELCGFGLVAAAARTASLIAALEPTEVMLVGIAGGIASRAVPGTAWLFDRVACHGVGVGTGAAFVPAGTLGWRHWEGDPPGVDVTVGDVIDVPSPADGVRLPGTLLSVCAAAAGPDDVAERLRLFPDAAAEDMEGFSVAAAGRMAGVPVRIVRGISNVAGDRDHRAWRIDEAAEAAASLAARLLAGDP